MAPLPRTSRTLGGAAVPVVWNARTGGGIPLAAAGRLAVMAGRGTPATAALDAAGIAYRLHAYRVAASSGAYGLDAAGALGVDPARMVKTLVAEVDGHPVLACVPVAGSLDLKALAAARGGKRATMAEPAAAQRLTGYVTGGISPLGTRRPLDVVLDRSVSGAATVYCSAGRRGLSLELAPGDLVAATGAVLAAIATP